MRHFVALEERERVRAMLVVQPGVVTELDKRLVPLQLLLRPLQVLERDRLVHDVGGELQHDPAELAGRAERLERVVEAGEDLRAELARRTVDAAARVRRHSLPQLRRQLLETDRMPRHHSEGLDVHDKPLRRPLGPALNHLLGR